MEKLRVAVLFGGVSSEHEVSLLSARSVLDNIPADRYEVVKLGITKKGEWWLYDGPSDKLPGSAWEKDPGRRRAFISPDADVHGIVALREDGCAETIRLDAVFPVMHGANGEDGTIQGLFTLAGIPFVGCPTAASAVCMDKALTKAVLSYYGVLQAKWEAAYADEFLKENPPVAARIEHNLGYPVFVKPANAGSSVGITKAKNRAELFEAVKTAAAFDKKIVFEESVKGREIECAVLGTTPPRASCCGEIRPRSDFYDYNAKYIEDSTELVIPARLPDETEQAIRRAAVEAFELLGCKGLTRMDFFVRESDGAVLLNEPNTIPGFTSISMYPKLFAASGLPYGELLDTLFKLALER